MIDSKYTNPLPSESIQLWLQTFERQQAFAMHAFDQLSDDQFFSIIAPGLNSCAIIANHLAGNMISRWTDFLTTDGEKESRDRDQEFALPTNHTHQERKLIMTRFEQGWETLYQTLRFLSPDDLKKVVKIRGVDHSVDAAVLRQIDHYSFHIGQCNVIARQLVGTDQWKWFTIAPGGSKALNAKLFDQQPRK